MIQPSVTSSIQPHPATSPPYRPTWAHRSPLGRWAMAARPARSPNGSVHPPYQEVKFGEIKGFRWRILVNKKSEKLNETILTNYYVTRVAGSSWVQPRELVEEPDEQVLHQKQTPSPRFGFNSSFLRFPQRRANRNKKCRLLWELK